MIIMTGRYEQKDQYVVYDTNSLIADIGGYLGQLLGHSVLSMYNNALQAVESGSKIKHF
jgi:hypothetical protein